MYSFDMLFGSLDLPGLRFLIALKTLYCARQANEQIIL